MNKDQNHSDQNLDLFSKIITGEASKSEKDEFETLINRDKNAKEEFNRIENLWKASISARGLTTEEIENDWLKIKSQIDQTKGTKPFLKIAASVFVVIALGITLSLVYFNRGTQYTAVKEIRDVTLADGSVITLNKGASISLEKDFNNEHREVKFSGEAFFSIAKNPDLPFLITVDKAVVEVVGTKFNLKHSKVSGTTEVTVTEGMVQFGSNEKKVAVKVNQSGIYQSKSKNLFVTTIDDPNFLSWKTKTLTFNDSPLSEVISKLNEVYDQNLELDGDIASCRVTVNFENETPENILNILEAALQLEITYNANKIIISGEPCK